MCHIFLQNGKYIYISTFISNKVKIYLNTEDKSYIQDVSSHELLNIAHFT